MNIHKAHSAREATVHKNENKGKSSNYLRNSVEVILRDQT